MKKILSIIIIATMVFAMSACSQKTETSEPTEEPLTQSALQESMKQLLDKGWQATDNGYIYTESNDYCDIEVNVRPATDFLDFEIHYDYGDKNNAMADTYDMDPTFASSIAAMWYGKIQDATTEDLKTINYIIYVGDKKVADATMTVEEAIKVAQETDD